MTAAGTADFAAFTDVHCSNSVGVRRQHYARGDAGGGNPSEAIEVIDLTSDNDDDEPIVDTENDNGEDDEDDRIVEEFVL